MRNSPNQQDYRSFFSKPAGLMLITALLIWGCANQSSFEYQVRVQELDTWVDIPHAFIRVEANEIAPASDYTDSGGTARLFLPSSIKDKPARIIVQATNYKEYVQNIDLRKEDLPLVIQLQPISSIHPAPIQQTATPGGACPWISYMNGKQPRDLSEKCLDALRDIGISGSSQKVTFYTEQGSAGVYGVCQDISGKGKLELNISVRDTIIASRFLITIAPQPIPNKSSYGFRLQPQTDSDDQTEMYIRFIEFTSGGIDDEIDEFKASHNWKRLNYWDLKFAYEFTGSKAIARINEISIPYTWSTDPQKRYLCLMYETMPTSVQPSRLEVQVSFP